MNEIMEKEMISINDMIYEVRGVQVMLDSDLAELYQVETKRINEAVKNNPDKFPERFYFRISESEYGDLKSKISTSKGGSRKGHTAFTEQGVYMHATREIAKKRNPIGLDENIDVAKRGGKIAGNARKVLEDILGESVITSSNLLNYEYNDGKQLIDN